jgi:hypothetical protein
LLGPDDWGMEKLSAMVKRKEGGKGVRKGGREA